MTHTTKINKKFDILLKATFLIATYLYLYFEIFYNKKLQYVFSDFSCKYFLTLYVFFIVILMPVNWITEAYKWKYSVKNIQKIQLQNSIKAVLASVAMGVFTPNRTGEIPGRAFYLNNCRLWEATFSTMIGAIAQLVVTLVSGFILLPFFLNKIINDNIILIVFTIISILLSIIITYLYFNINHLSKLSNWKIFRKAPGFSEQIEIFKSFSSKMLFHILLLSLLRYVIFSIQFILTLKSFSINLSFSQYLITVPVYYLIITAVPTIALSEIGVRGSAGVFIFSFYGLKNDAFQFNLLIASTFIWIINVVIPAIIGTFFIPSVKFTKLASQ